MDVVVGVVGRPHLEGQAGRRDYGEGVGEGGVWGRRTRARAIITFRIVKAPGLLVILNYLI